MTMFFFFRNRIVKNANNIPKEGPTILVANHPVTFLDPLLVAVATNRQVHFLAKGAMFKNRLIRAIFKKFNMIPIHRAQDNPSEMHKNQDTFEYCYEHLEKGGLILIFPEGISVTDRTLKPLKTGVARIALGAEAKNGFKLGVKIVPVGLTYEGPHQFRKDVLVNVGNPIAVKELNVVHQKNEKIAINRIMDEVKFQLEQLTLQVDQEALTSFVDFIVEENAQLGLDFEENVASIKAILQEIESKSNGIAQQHLIEKMKELRQLGDDIGIQNLHSAKGAGKIVLESIVSLGGFIVGIPLILFGFIHNAIPYYFSPRLARLISKEYEYQGPITMTAGMVLCLVLYPMCFLLMLSYSGNLFLSLLYLLVIPFSGIITYGFFEQLNWTKHRWEFLLLFNKRSEQVAEFILAKKSLLKEIDNLSIGI